MSDELEIIGAAAVGAAAGKAVARDTTGDGYLNGPCPNCGTEIAGEYCSTCGQSAKDLKRPIFSLAIDVIGDVFSFDGRLFRTVPSLIFRPGHVTRAYIEGRRARYVPPFRLFLIASVVFFLLVFSIGENQNWFSGEDFVFNAQNGDFQSIELADKPGFMDIYDSEGVLNEEAARIFLEQYGEIEDEESMQSSLEELANVNPVELRQADIFAMIQKWAPRLSFLLLPANILFLLIVHFWIRRIYVYDHIIFALHYQTFIYFALTLTILLAYVSIPIAWAVFGLGAPYYLHRQMRISYGTSRFFNLIRVFLFLIYTVTVMSVLMALVSVAGAAELGLLKIEDLETLLSELHDGAEAGLTDDG